MSILKGRFIALWSLLFLACAPCAHAQWAVIDVGAITQLIQQVTTMEQQLSTAKNQLTQAKDEYNSMTGGRGMEGLASGNNRNYLPTDWNQLQAALQGTAGAYGALNAALSSLIQANAVLSPADVAKLSPAERDHLEAARRSAALLQATSREALATTSQRFASIQSLISAISGAQDQKAILDLQARIARRAGNAPERANEAQHAVSDRTV
ncbi:MAG: type IV secretion system protein [Gammaproteobacteria bacterium]